MVRSSLSLQWSFLALVAAVALLSTAALTYFASNYAARNALEHRGEDLVSIAQRITSQLDQALADRLSEIEKLARFTGWRDFSNIETARAEFDELARNFTDYAWLGFVDEEGTIRVAKSSMLEGVNVDGRDWFEGGLKGPFIGDVHSATLLGNILNPETPELVRFVDIAAPVKDDDGHTVGVLGSHLYANWAAQLIRPLTIELAGIHDVSIVVLNSRNEVVFAPEQVAGKINTLPSTQRLEWDRSGIQSESWSGQNLFREFGLTAFTTAQGFNAQPSLGWKVLVHQSHESLMQPVRDLQRQMVAIGVITLLIFLTGATFFATRLIRPLRDLAKKLRNVKEFDDLLSISTGSKFFEIKLIERQLHSLAKRVEDGQVALANQLAHSEAQFRQIMDLRSSVATDPLTGALNRRGLEDRLARLRSMDREKLRSVSVVMCDIDHFKKINDEKGHAAGDTVLRQFSSTILSMIRDSDSLARMGGEEFVLLLPNTTQIDALQLAERIRQTVERLEFITDTGLIQVTASFGIATDSTGEKIDTQALIDQADENMYNAKKNGRNRVMTSNLSTSD